MIPKFSQGRRSQYQLEHFCGNLMHTKQKVSENSLTTSSIKLLLCITLTIKPCVELFTVNEDVLEKDTCFVLQSPHSLHSLW